MAVYFANKIPRQPGACTAVSWSGHAATSARAPAMCAVAYSSGSLGVYTEEGDDVTASRPVRSDAPGVYPCALAWHPRSPLLAIGWTDGRVALWSGTELRVSGEETSTHAGRSITCIAWSPTGHRVVTGDDAGKTQVWTVDDKLRPKPTGFRCAKPAPGARTSHVVIPNDAAVDEEGAEPDRFLFYYAVNEGLADSGYVCVGIDTAGDAGAGESKAAAAPASRKIFDSPGAIHAALYHDGVGNLVTLGTDSVLSIFAPPKGDSIEGAGPPEGTQQSKWTVVSSTKLPTEGDAELTWTEPGVLAVVNDRDPSCAVRVFDLNTGDNYVLVPPARRKSQGLPKTAESAAADPTGRRLSCLCYDADAKTLACGQRDGRVVMFRRTAPPRGRAGRRAGADEGKRGGEKAGDEKAGGEEAGGEESDDDFAPEDAWRVCASLDTGGTLERVHFATGRGARLLVAVCRDGARLCVRVKLNDKTRGGVSVVQVAADSVVVEATDGSRAPARLNTTERGMQITGADATSRHLLVWNSARAEVHETRGSGFARVSAFDWSGRARGRSGSVRGESNAPASSSSQAMAIHGERIYRACPGRAVVEVTDLAGDVVDALAYEEAQGAAEFVDCNGDFLCAATASGHLRFWRLPADGVGRAEAHGPKGGAMIPADICGETHAPGSPGPDGDDGDVPEFSGQLPFAIDSVRVNCDGTKASVLFAHRGHVSVLSTLAVYDVDTDGYRTFDFAITGRAPESHAWDAAAPNVLAAQTAFDENAFADADEKTENVPTKDEGDSRDPAPAPAAGPYASETGHGRSAATMRRHANSRGVVVFTLFASPRGLLPQEAHPVPDGFESLLGLAAPSLFVCNKAAAQSGGGACFAVTMRDFVGMEHLDAEAKAELLTFNYDLAVGDVDRARALVKATTEPAVWEAMAHMCIKNKRLDVAETCLANLGHVRGGRAVRDGADEPELDARVASVAVHLGLVDDAAVLYEQCHRHDLLNRLYQAMGRWDDAIAVASGKDRIHLKSTHYAHGRHLESVGDVSGAIRAYEKSGCAAVDVPRMLHGRGMTDTLERYVIGAGSRELTRWWARYCESAGDYEKALQGYQASGDYLSLVRTYCAQGDLEIAAQLVEESGDPAAAFHLARTFEAMDEYADAIRFFGAAGRHGHAARLARRCGMDNELMHLALQSPPEMMLDSARYLEERGELEKATTLYHKAGNAGKALELCFAHDLFEPLAGIVKSVADDEDADPKLVAKCAAYFLDNGRYDDAARLLVKGGDHARGLELIVEHDVKIDEELAEALTPPRDADPKDGGLSEEARKALLMKIAAVCKNQGSYHLACKKYTQAGDKMKAMKALLKSGDTEKICFFAGVSRQREIYVMTANYLQTLRWHGDPELTKHIVQFYTKARAVESLSGFYESVAQIEIDEYRDYDKAADALRDAAKHLAKSKADGHDAMMRSLEARTELVETFVRARTLLAAGDVAEATRLCERMIADPRARDESEVTIRVGDVYAMMVEHWYQAKDLKRCRELVATMRERAGLAAEPYLEATMLAEIDGETGARGGWGKAGSRREDAPATSPTEEEGYLHGADDDADEEFYMDEEVHSDDEGS